MAEQPGLGFAGLLRQLRAEARLTQEELAEAAGLSPRSVSDLERGINRTARKDTAELLAGALGLAEPVRAVFVAAARGRAPAVEVLAAVHGYGAPGSGRVWAGCPYLGLVPFDERDAGVYYGRSELTAQLVRRLLDRLDGTGILLVAGESGTGKSSLLRAGLMPRLAAGALGPGSERWPRRVIRPTGNPLRELAVQLADVADADPVSVYRSLSAAPGEAPMLVDLAVRTAAGRGMTQRSGALADAVPALPRLVLVVDQFEELFTADVDADVGRVEREAFVAALHAAATVPAGPRNLPSALVVAAVRADFLGRLIAYRPLKAALDTGPFTVGPMSEAELRLAITGPAAEAGLAVEPGVVDAVIAELREGAWGELGSGVLPLMSQAMAATWERREGSALTLRAYRRAGGVADAVNRSAQAAYDTLTSPQQDAARLVFTQLTVLTPDGQFARRRCSRTDLRSSGAEMAADIDAVIDLFSAQRLVVLGQDSVEIAHDMLLQAWKQLRDWLGDDQLDRALHSQVVTDADTWDANRRDSSYLYRPGRLATVDAAAARWQDAPTRYLPLPATSRAFLDAAHRAARRSTQRRRAVIAGLLALTVIAISAASIAVHDAANASRQHVIALSRQLAAESLAIDSSDPFTARQLAVAAWRVSPTDQALTVMTKLLIDQQQDGILPGDPSDHGVRGVAFSQDGRLLAAAYGDGYVRLWDPATGQPVGAPLLADPGSGRGVNGVAFSSDGRLLAAADADGYVRLWDPATGRPVGAPLPADPGPGGGVNGVAFSSDGRLLAAADADGYVRLWDPATGRQAGAPLQTESGPAGGVNGVAFSRDGRQLASADAFGNILVWNLATSRQVGSLLPGRVDSAKAVAFSSDDNLVAGAGSDGNILVWNLTTRMPVGAPLQTGPVTGVAFSPDGKLLASADAFGNVLVWNLATRQAYAAILQSDAVPGPGMNGVAFSPNGELVASAGADGTVRLWDPVTSRAPGAPIQADIGPGGGMNGVAFSPDGKLAGVGADGTVQLWDPATGQPVGAPIPAGAAQGGVGVLAVAFSPDGRLLASVDVDGNLQLWNPATARPDGALLPAGTPVLGVNGLAFSPDGSLLASVGAGGIVEVWVPAKRILMRSLRCGARYGAKGVAFGPGDRLLAAACDDGYVRLWDPATGQPAGAPLPADPGSGGGVNGVAFSRDGRLLASADADGYVRLWDPATGQPVGAPLPAGTGPGDDVRGVAFNADGRLLASADANGTVQVWQIATFANPYAALCADVGPLTKAKWAQYAAGEPQPSVCS